MKSNPRSRRIKKELAVTDGKVKALDLTANEYKPIRKKLGLMTFQ